MDYVTFEMLVGVIVRGSVEVGVFVAVPRREVCVI